jgi:hypothetical protein
MLITLVMIRLEYRFQDRDSLLSVSALRDLRLQPWTLGF